MKIEILNIPEHLFSGLFCKIHQAVLESAVPIKMCKPIEDQLDKVIGYEFECKP